MVNTVMSRWRIERDYQELKQALGLGHYESRNWRDFHHHASLCMAAYGFLIMERLSGRKKYRSMPITCRTRRFPTSRGQGNAMSRPPLPAIGAVWLGS